MNSHKNLSTDEQKIQKIIQLSCENNDLQKYLKHFEHQNHQLKQYINKIESVLANKFLKILVKSLSSISVIYKIIKIKIEFSLYFSKKRSSAFDLINFSVIPYDFRFQRPQQLANELAKRGNQIFYIDPDFLYLKNKNDKLVPEIIKVKENLYKIKLATHNKYTKRKFIYYGEISKEDISELTESINILLKITNSSNVILKIDNPPWLSIAEKVKKPILYDCLDDHGALEIKANDVDRIEKDLIKKSDIIISCSEGLTKKLSNLTFKKVTTIGNACEYEHFSEKTLMKTPDDLKTIPKPWIGYCGAIAQRFDEKLLEKIAKLLPQYSFILIGRLDKPEVVDLARKYKNIYLLGEKDYKYLPAYYQKFDVCFSPYVVDIAAKNLDPVKIYEYLATGKPTVISNISGLYHLKKLIYISKNAEDFCNNIEKALIEKNTRLIFERKSYAKENTWEKRSIVLEDLIKQFLKI